MLKTKLTEKFFRYVAVESQSNAANAGTVPSTHGQLELAKLLSKELKELGLADVKVNDQAIVIAHLPANVPADFKGRVPKIGFLAHLDTVNMNLSPVIKPQIVKNYDGKDITLNKEKNIFLTIAEHPEILKYVGDDIIVSDGTSVLGADNKAAVASIMTAIEEIKNNQDLYHGEVYVAFVPDEEIGLVGAKTMNLADFPVDFAYTIDSCELGEVVYETFNAGSAVVEIQGTTAHPMSAKGILVNPTLVAVDLVSSLNKIDTPEHTENKEGYFWVTAVSSNTSTAKVNISIRDHDKKLYEARKKYLAELIEFIVARNPKAKISYKITDTYSNISDAITEDNKFCIDFIFDAMKNLAVTPKVIAMRGGTDGSALSSRGLITPNFFTGAHNFHSNCEFLPLNSFEKSCQMIMEISKLVFAKASKEA